MGSGTDLLAVALRPVPFGFLGRWTDRSGAEAPSSRAATARSRKFPLSADAPIPRGTNFRALPVLRCATALRVQPGC